jgi:disulfide bond formation protein DsbB
MYRRFAVLMSLALCGVLAGCSSSTTISVSATGSFISLIQAKFQIAHSGNYDYELTYGHLPSQPGAQPQTCLPVAGFEFHDEWGVLQSDIATPTNASGQTKGSLFFTAGTWTGSDGMAGDPSIPNVGPPSPPGTFEALSCPWSLTLTPSN